MLSLFCQRPQGPCRPSPERQGSRGARCCCHAATPAGMPPCAVRAGCLQLSSVFLLSHRDEATSPSQVGHVKNITGSNNTFGVRVYLTSAAQVRLQQPLQRMHAIMNRWNGVDAQ